MEHTKHQCIFGQVWHITQRCYENQYLLESQVDRRRWLYWLFQARIRYKLSVLNYIVTSNHVHLLVHDKGDRSIADAMQFIFDRSAKEFNCRQGRTGAFWNKQFHAAAIETDEHLARCMAYIDLNMVRAGEVAYPGEWSCSGYYETVHRRRRGKRIDIDCLCRLLQVDSPRHLLRCRERWHADQLNNGALGRESLWTDSVAVGTLGYALKLKRALSLNNEHLRVCPDKSGTFAVREYKAVDACQTTPFSPSQSCSTQVA